MVVETRFIASKKDKKNKIKDENYKKLCFFITVSVLHFPVNTGAFMFRNYLKIALRKKIKHKGYSVINILGLATGISCFTIILLYIQDELLYCALQSEEKLKE